MHVKIEYRKQSNTDESYYFDSSSAILKYIIVDVRIISLVHETRNDTYRIYLEDGNTEPFEITEEHYHDLAQFLERNNKAELEAELRTEPNAGTNETNGIRKNFSNNPIFDLDV